MYRNTLYVVTQIIALEKSRNDPEELVTLRKVADNTIAIA
jgi:hypothetical protein